MTEQNIRFKYYALTKRDYDIVMRALECYKSDRYHQKPLWQ